MWTPDVIRDARPHMSLTVLALAGAIPIVTVFTLMTGFRWSAARSMGTGWSLATVLGLALWRMPAVWLGAAAISGALQALEIIIIVFGAIVLMNTLAASGAISTIRWHISHIVKDRRVQLLLIGTGFMLVIEGVAGFGTPGALAAPLLMGLGFPPLAAVVFGLVFNAPQPPFGAAGTPVIGGIGAVIDEQVLSAEVGTTEFLRSVSGWSAVVTGSTHVFWGLFAVFLMLYWFGHEGRRSLAGAVRDTIPVAPFAVLLGVIGGGTQWLVAWFFGPELPDIIAGFVVVGAGAVLARNGVLVPSSAWTFPSSAEWPDVWCGGLDRANLHPADPSKDMPVVLAWTPYLLVSLVLLVTRWPGLGLVAVLQDYSLVVPSILGQDLSFSLRYLYLPGFVPFMPVAILTVFLHRMPGTAAVGALKKSFSQILAPALTLIIAVSMTQVMIQSATNDRMLPGMMQALSRVLALGAGAAIPLVAPWIGTLGAFITGSNTSSNILFSVLQHDAAEAVGASRTIVVALQNVGGGIGNMISVLNIAAISGVVGMTGREGDILRKTVVPTIVYAISAGVLGLILTLVFGYLY